MLWQIWWKIAFLWDSEDHDAGEPFSHLHVVVREKLAAVIICF